MRFKSFVFSSLILALGLSQGAWTWSKTKVQEPEVIDVAAILNSKSLDSEKSEQVAQAAERLWGTAGFTYVPQLIDTALKLDPTNLRARAYKGLVDFVMYTQGIVGRVKPLVKSANLHFQKEFAKQVILPKSDGRDFWYNANGDITTEAQWQAYSMGLQKQFRQLRTHFYSLRNESLDVKVQVNKSSLHNVLRDCKVTQPSENVFNIFPCADLRTESYHMGYADWEALRHITAIYQIYATIWNAYDATGLVDLSHKLNHPNLTDRDSIKIIRTEPRLGQLIDVATLREILDLGKEGVDAMKTILSNQGELCPTGSPSDKNRPGAMFSNGFCASEGLTKGLMITEGITNGSAPVTFNTSEEYRKKFKRQGLKTVVNGPTFLSGSVTNLQTKLPQTFNPCGAAASMPDTTVGGVFPNGDANRVYRLIDVDYQTRNCRPKQ